MSTITGSIDIKRTQEQNTSSLLLTAPRLAEILSVSVRTLWRLRAARKLPQPVQLGGSLRWRAEEVQAWIDAGCPSIID